MKLATGLQSMIRKLLAALTFVMVAMLGFGQAPVQAQNTAEQASYNFEFLDLQNNYQLLSTYPQGKSAEIVVASQNADVRNLLPISLVITINGKVSSRGTISNNPQSNCRGADGCSIKGPNIASLSENDSFKLTATDKDGNLVATHTQGSQPQAQTPVSQSTNKTEPLSSAKQVTTQAITYTWWLPLIFGLMWIGLWGVRNKLAVFKWPGFLWYLIPLFWFVPWFLWWPFNWLVWGGGWF